MKTFGVSDTGKVRQLNEDSCYLSNDPVGMFPNLYIIADGMGGHNAGEVASALSIEKFVEYCLDENVKEDNLTERLIKGVKYANNEIYKRSVSDITLRGMGTTFVVCTIVDDVIYIANVGDSRAYVFDKGENSFDQVTIDHSYVEELVQAGKITREESYIHPDRNIITRALGTTEDICVDLFKFKNDNKAKILLCSDGLTTMMMDNEISEILITDDDLEIQGKKLVEQSIDNGGLDNITIIIIDTKLEGRCGNV